MRAETRATLVPGASVSSYRVTRGPDTWPITVASIPKCLSVSTSTSAVRSEARAGWASCWRERRSSVRSGSRYSPGGGGASKSRSWEGAASSPDVVSASSPVSTCSASKAGSRSEPLHERSLELVERAAGDLRPLGLGVGAMTSAYSRSPSTGARSRALGLRQRGGHGRSRADGGVAGRPGRVPGDVAAGGRGMAEPGACRGTRDEEHAGQEGEGRQDGEAGVADRLAHRGGQRAAENAAVLAKAVEVEGGERVPVGTDAEEASAAREQHRDPDDDEPGAKRTQIEEAAAHDEQHADADERNRQEDPGLADERLHRHGDLARRPRRRRARARARPQGTARARTAPGPRGRMLVRAARRLLRVFVPSVLGRARPARVACAMQEGFAVGDRPPARAGQGQGPPLRGSAPIRRGGLTGRPPKERRPGPTDALDASTRPSRDSS